MPYKKNYRRRYKRRNRSKFTSKSSIARPRISFADQPKSKMVKFRYASDVTLNPGAGLIAGHVYRANGLFDPDVTSTGHQPYGFDHTMNFYDHYTVLGSKISCQFFNGSGSNIAPSYCGVTLTDSSSSIAGFSNPSHLIESNLLKLPVLIVGGNGGNSVSSGKYPIKSQTFSAKKFFARNPLGASELTGTATTDPVEEAYFTIFAGSVAGVDSGTVSCLVTIDYFAVLSERQSLSQS